jgi:glycosyltransferase involved in cell wall biosynthesis
LIIKYLTSDLIAFPSYIETFGLPLAEAACLGKEIICSDTDFAREVLNDYQGAEYLDAGNAHSWADSIEQKIIAEDRSKHDKLPYKFERTSGWDDFFRLVE